MKRKAKRRECLEVGNENGRRKEGEKKVRMEREEEGRE